MAKAWIFIDEQGDPRYTESASVYFSLCAVTVDDPRAICATAERIRHAMWSDGHFGNWGCFHAQQDCWPVRTAFYEALREMPLLRADVVALRKANIYESLREPRLIYRNAANQLLSFLIPQLQRFDELHIVCAQWKEVPHLDELIREVLTEGSPQRRPLWNRHVTVSVCPASAHAGLQVADYVAWASSRRRVQGDPRCWERVMLACSESSDHALFDYTR